MPAEKSDLRVNFCQATIHDTEMVLKLTGSVKRNSNCSCSGPDLTFTVKLYQDKIPDVACDGRIRKYGIEITVLAWLNPGISKKFIFIVNKERVTRQLIWPRDLLGTVCKNLSLMGPLVNRHGHRTVTTTTRTTWTVKTWMITTTLKGRIVKISLVPNLLNYRSHHIRHIVTWKFKRVELRKKSSIGWPLLSSRPNYLSIVIWAQ